jgi:hypothetical protein
MVLNQRSLDNALLAISPEFPYVRKWINHLISHKGLPGFVQVWKKLKAWAIKLISGENHYKEDWFSVDYYLGYSIPRAYKQLFHVLVRGIIRSSVDLPGNRKLLQKVLSVLNIHHVVSGPYNPDFKDQIATALSKREVPLNHNFWLKSLRIVCKIIQVRSKSKIGRIGPTGQSVALSPGRNGSWGKFVASTIVDRYGGFDHVINAQKLNRRLERDFMGNLTPIGDTGGKTRLILVGNPFLQSMLTPLKRELLDILQALPTDCTFRQHEGVQFIISKQKLGVTLYSVDLKDATWNFPSSLQEEVLKCIGCKKEVLDLIFRTRVHNPLDGKLHLIEKGQAMGLGPSFPLFSLTHNMVLFTLCQLVGVIPVDTYRVLGDDVIIADKGVYKRYIDFLRQYKVPVSSSKSLTSSSTAEFAGRIIYRGFDITPIKWKALTWNSMSSLYWKYRSVFSALTKLSNFVSKKDRLALFVLGPIPKRLGGLNLREGTFPSSKGIISLRKGILESGIERSQFGDSSGLPKLPNHLWEADDLTPTYDIDQFRFLDGLLNTDVHLQTPWGILPSLCPNPFRFLNQVGLTLRGIPLRESFDPERGFKFRFRPSRQENYTWKELVYQALDLSEELNDVQNKEKSSFESFVSEDQREVILYYYSK